MNIAFDLARPLLLYSGVQSRSGERSGPARYFNGLRDGRGARCNQILAPEGRRDLAGFSRACQDFAPGRSDHKTEALSGCIIISDRGKTLFSLETRGRPRFGVSDGFFHTVAAVEACPVRERRPAVTDRRYSGPFDTSVGLC